MQRRPDADQIQVIFDANTRFYVRRIYENGTGHEDVKARADALTEEMPVDLKGEFSDDVFYATEVRLIQIL